MDEPEHIDGPDLIDPHISQEATPVIEKLRKYDVNLHQIPEWNNLYVFSQLNKLESPMSRTGLLPTHLQEGGKHLTYELRMMEILHNNWASVQSLFETNGEDIYSFSISNNEGTHATLSWNGNLLRQQALLMILVSDVGKLGAEQIRGDEVGVVGRIYQQVHLQGAHKDYLRFMVHENMPQPVEEIIRSIKQNTDLFQSIFIDGNFMNMPLALGLFVSEQVLRQELTSTTLSQSQIEELTKGLRLNSDDTEYLTLIGFPPVTTRMGEFFTKAHLILGRKYLEQNLGPQMWPQIALSLSHHFSQREDGTVMVCFDKDALQSGPSTRNTLRLLALFEILDKVDASIARGGHSVSKTKVRIRAMLSQNLEDKFADIPGLQEIYMEVFDKLEDAGVFESWEK